MKHCLEWRDVSRELKTTANSTRRPLMPLYRIKLARFRQDVERDERINYRVTKHLQPWSAVDTYRYVPHCRGVETKTAETAWEQAKG